MGKLSRRVRANMKDRQVTVTKISGGLENGPVQCKKKITPPYPKSLFPLHSLMVFVGHKGTGKTNAAVNLAQTYLNYGSFNRIFIISPTYWENASMQTLEPKPEKEDVYADIHSGIHAVTEIIAKVHKSKEEYDEKKKYRDAYQKWRRNGKTGVGMTEKELYILMKRDYEKPEEFVFPRPLLLIDDMSHSSLYREGSKKNPFGNLCLRHRHISEVGITIMMLVQNFNTGVPKFIRENADVFFLWPTHDMRQLEAIFDGVSKGLSEEDFYKLYEEAIKDDPHAFMTINVRESDPSKMVRRRFDEFLSLSGGEEGGEDEVKERTVGGVASTVDAGGNPVHK